MKHPWRSLWLDLVSMSQYYFPWERSGWRRLWLDQGPVESSWWHHCFALAWRKLATSVLSLWVMRWHVCTAVFDATRKRLSVTVWWAQCLSQIFQKRLPEQVSHGGSCAFQTVGLRRKLWCFLFWWGTLTGGAWSVIRHNYLLIYWYVFFSSQCLADVWTNLLANLVFLLLPVSHFKRQSFRDCWNCHCWTLMYSPNGKGNVLE